jgi:hypothetical protein
MALLNINGVDLPTPSGLIVGTMDISNAERNASGTMIIEIIATKRKLSLTWANISNTDMVAVRSQIENRTTMSVNFIDPSTGSAGSGQFYKGDRAVGVLYYWNGEIYWTNFTFDLIEL